jgi:pimeloyl-ACP methyl ester carboxylesterase
MSEPTLNYVNCPDAQGSHRMAYWQWGNPQAEHVVLCVHGLSRQGRDFDVLARALIAQSPELKVVCPDVVGRGQSDHLSDPAGYQIPAYAADMLVLLAQLKPKTLDWVGTSMGGLIGLVISGQPELPLSAPVRRLVLNDVGPVIEWQALQRIGEYLGRPLTFASVSAASDFLLSISSSFGPHTPEAWLALSGPMIKPILDGNGQFALHYDPAIAVPFRGITPEAALQGEALLWHLYDAITATTLLTRGAESDLLSPETAQAMTQRGPKAQLIEFAGVGHAPTFVALDQVQAVASFLLN